MIRKAVIAVCTVVALGMAALGIIRPETAYDPYPTLPSFPRYQLGLTDGYLCVSVQRDLRRVSTPMSVEKAAFSGWEFGRMNTGRQEVLVLRVAAWLLAVLFGSYPAFVLVRGRVLKRRRRRDGLCGKCGYDLTGNVTGRCSECGKKIA